MTPTFAMSSSNNFHISVSNSFWRMVSGSGGGTAGGSGGNSSSSNRVFCRLDDSRLLCRVLEPSSPVESCLENIDPLLVAPALPMLAPTKTAVPLSARVPSWSYRWHHSGRVITASVLFSSRVLRRSSGPHRGRRFGSTSAAAAAVVRKPNATVNNNVVRQSPTIALAYRLWPASFSPASDRCI